MTVKLTEEQIQEVLSANTFIARLIDSSDLKGLPANKIDILLDADLTFKSFVQVAVLPLIKDAKEGVFYILPDRSIWFKDHGVWAQPTVEAIAKLIDIIEVNNSIGKVYDGTTIPEGTLLEDILRKMLHKCDVPELEDAEITGLRVTMPGAATTTYVNEDFRIVAPGELWGAGTELKIQKELGSIEPAYGTSGNRVNDDFTKYTYISGIIPGGSVEKTDDSPLVMPSAQTMLHGDSFDFKMQLEVGTSDQPKDAEGDDYLKPVPTGTIIEKTVNFYCMKPFYSNSSDEGIRPYMANWKNNPTLPKTPDETKHVLKFVRTGLPEETNKCYFWFAIPNEYTLQHIYILDENTGELMPAEDILVLTETPPHSISGYKVYRDIREIQLGERTVVIEYENNL